MANEFVRKVDVRVAIHQNVAECGRIDGAIVLRARAGIFVKKASGDTFGNVRLLIKPRILSALVNCFVCMFFSLPLSTGACVFYAAHDQESLAG